MDELPSAFMLEPAQEFVPNLYRNFNVFAQVQ